MLEYLPWSKKVLNECLNDYQTGKFSILDIELGGQCNYHCIYCDSPMRNKMCVVDLERIEAAFVSKSIKWVFICGLGEPTATGNLDVLLNVLKLCEKYGAKCSIFSNLSILTDEIKHYINSGILNILFKYDSADVSRTMNLYGVPDVNKQLFNIARVKDLVNLTDNCTNLAASIVPTKINKDEILDIVKDCIKNNIYPLIAELENSGEAQNYYEQLALSENELREIKEQVNLILGEEYIVPVCPSVICGVHIRHDGNVTVDEWTGLSCHWFWLEEPKTHVIGNFNSNDYEIIIKNIEQYREATVKSVEELLHGRNESVFGGCGGDATYLLKKNLKIFSGRV